LGAVVVSGFLAKAAGPPHLFYTSASIGLQKRNPGAKKSFSTISAKIGNSALVEPTRSFDRMRTALFNEFRKIDQ
jgi:hypothetical protein